MMNLVQIKDEVRVHTGISKSLKKKFLEMSVATKIPQTVLFNTALSYGLAHIETADVPVATTSRTITRKKK